VTPVSPHLIRAAWTLLAGAALATAAVNITPGAYYDAVEYRLADLPPWLIPGRESIPRTITPMQLVEEVVMSLILFLLAKEGWEAWRCERGPFSGARAGGAVIVALGGMAGAALVWAVLTALTETAPEAEGARGWVVPLAGDAILAYLFGRMILGERSAALQLLLFTGIAGMVMGCVTGGLMAPGGPGLRWIWLVLPLVAAVAGYVIITRPLDRADLSERRRMRAGSLWPWAGIAVVCWLGVALSGLPPALGLLPLLPAMPHARQSFGLFAAAEEFLTDPLNRATQRLLPALPVLTGLFGLTHGAADLGAIGASTWVAVAAVLAGKPAGLFVAMLLARALLPGLITLRDMAIVAVLGGIGLTGPLLLLDPALPGGAVREAARAGIVLALLAVSVLVALVRLRRPALDTAR
jgi:Na+:H+ antiporter, NhaA family